MNIQFAGRALRKSLQKIQRPGAYENMGVRLTYGQVDKLSGNFAAYLQQDLGLKKGERIAIQMPNLLQFPIAFFGRLAGGIDCREYQSSLYTA